MSADCKSALLLLLLHLFLLQSTPCVMSFASGHLQCSCSGTDCLA